MNIYVWKLSKSAAQKKVFFFTFFTFQVPFNGLFAPTSQSRMSNIYRDSESLGKSNGKKWSQIWTFLFENCIKSPHKKSFFLHFFGLLRFLVFFNGLFAPTCRSRMSNIFRDSESLGKSNVKKWSQIWKVLFENCLKSPRNFFFLFFFLHFFGLLRFLVFFNGLFAPTSRSRMSNIFKDSESLGKSNGKKWSQIWTFLFENCLKSPRKKKFFSSFFSVFFGFWSFLMVFLPPLPEVGCPIFLEIGNPWGKVLERSGLRYEHFCLKIVQNCRAKKKVFFLSLFHFWGTV